jgi:excisionase family DNA binding protein
MVAYQQHSPSEQDIMLARASQQVLSHHARQNQSLQLRLTDEHTLELPASAVTLLMDILGAMASGQSVTLIPQDAELTTVQAANILNVSRPFLIKLLEEGHIPYRKVGKHRRIRLEDVMRYKQSIDREREAVLDQLVADAQEQDMGYKE